MNVLRRALGDQRGASVVEFALVAPAFLMILIGGFYLGMAGLAASSLRYAVEAGARCASVNTTVCSSNSATQTYARRSIRPSAPATAQPKPTRRRATKALTRRFSRQVAPPAAIW
jgi:Flp pilus assembly protein TadG